MKPQEIKKGIYWVGAIDWDLRNFHGYLTQRGTSYNAYLIVDEKVALVDTVKAPFCDRMLARIKAIVDPAKIDYLISNHVEMDHSGSLPRMADIARGAEIVASSQGEKGLKMHYRRPLPIKTVKSGDSLSLGRRSLRFTATPMVHWPDSMVTYIPEDKLLLPNDAFGQHIASSARFDDDFDIGIINAEAAKYYANIVLPYGAQVKRALEALSALDIDMIAPSHGFIWRKNLASIIELYNRWSGNEVKNKAVVVYDSMWGSTKAQGQAIADAFGESGIDAYLVNLKASHISDIMTEILEARYICVGSPTLNNNMLPSVSAFLTYLKGLAPKNRIAMAFGSYGWGGQSVGQIQDILKGCGFDMLELVKTQYVPDAKDLEAIKEKVNRAINNMV